MRKMIKQAAFSICGVLAAQVAVAEPTQFDFDKAHSDITFQVGHLGYSNTHGRFDKFDGQLMLDVDDLSQSSVEVIIQTASVDTSWEKRDTHLKTADFFDVETHPTMTFKSTSIAMASETQGKMTGSLTILDKTHPVTLDITINKIAPHPRNSILMAGITATGVLQRSMWGMDKGVPGIGDEIELRLDIEALQAQ